MFCSRCGQPLEESDRFCPKCGQKIEDSVREAMESITLESMITEFDKLTD